VIVVDHQANALLYNPAYLRIVPEAAIPSQLPDAAQRWTAYNERHQRIRQDDFPGARALRGETVAGAEFLHRAPDGQETWVRIGAVPLRDSAGTISGALCVIVDIGAQKRVEEQLRELTESSEERVATRTVEFIQAQEALRQSQKLESMGQLTGGIAHNLYNLLTPIIGSLDLLQARGLGGQRERRLIEGALQSAERAKTLVQRLLAFARRQPLQPTAVDITAIVGGMAELIASTLGPQVRVQIDMPAGLPMARADANQLETAILNLAVNARDAMPEGGTLTVSAAEATVKVGHPSSLLPGQYVHLSVTDTGTGMDEVTLSRAVEPFFSTKGIGKGTGLGLSTIHGLALQLGGALLISSKPSHGTKVELWLPLEARPSVVHERQAPSLPRSDVRGTALLVDDEELVRMSTGNMLVELGYVVVEASSAEEALHLINNGLVPAVLITDHSMLGITGTQLACSVQERLPTTSVLIISRYAEVEDIAPDLPRLTKPFRHADFPAMVMSLPQSLNI
jgi:PAS domain S-box-containing protein